MGFWFAGLFLDLFLRVCLSPSHHAVAVTASLGLDLRGCRDYCSSCPRGCLPLFLATHYISQIPLQLEETKCLRVLPVGQQTGCLFHWVAVDVGGRVYTPSLSSKIIVSCHPRGTFTPELPAAPACPQASRLGSSVCRHC